MDYSPCRLEEHDFFTVYTQWTNFLGAGVELTPGHFRLSGFYGTFKNLLAVQDSVVYGSSTIPIYDRIAFGERSDLAQNTPISI